MQDAVERCAPYLALDLHEIEEIKLASDLPEPNNKRIRNAIDTTRKMLATAGTRSQIFSEPFSGSKSRSSKSSLISFE